MKKLLTILMLLAASLPLWAYDFEVDGIYYNKVGEDLQLTYASESYNSYSGDIVIPSTVSHDGTSYNVTQIDAGAFYGCTGLTSITIPNSVTSIGSSAFSGCTGLTSITIPNSVTSIGIGAFYYCSGLTSITIPNSVTSIGEQAFSGCTFSNIYISDIATIFKSIWSALPHASAVNLYLNGELITELVIPDGITTIGNYAFQNCTGLTSITIPNSVTSISIGYDAFDNCTSLKEVKIEDGDEALSLGYNFSEGLFYDCPLESLYLGRNLSYEEGKSPFYKNKTLKEITIGNSVTSIGEDAFQYCTRLTKVTIPNSVTSIGNGAFFKCTGLTTVTIPNSVTSIGEKAFTGCTGLTSITIPNSVTSIGNYAFDGCTGLTSITIPNSVTEISYDAFRQCTSLKEVKIEDGDETLSLGSNDYSLGLFYDSPIESLYLGRNLSYEEGRSPFYNNETLKEITIGNSVTSIGEQAFTGCTRLTDVTIGNGVTSIGINAFFVCQRLTGVYISDLSAWCRIKFDDSYSNPLTYARNLYINNELVTSLVIPDDVTSIGEWAFSYCAGLTSITIPNSVTSIGAGAFYDCYKLSTITCNATTPPTVESNTFDNYNATVYVPAAGLALYQQDAVWSQFNFAAPFELKYSVTDANNKYVAVIQDASYTSYNGAIVIPSTVTYNGTTFSVTSIGSAAFHGCKGLTSITIPNSVTSIGQQAFQNCTGLTSITIPNSVTSIGEQAFSGCKFSNIYFDDIATICNGVWSALPRASAVNLYLNGELITELVIPDGITTIGNYAFQNCTGLTSVTIPNSVTSIGAIAFRDCTGLTEVTIGENVATIGDEAFWGCTGLTSITIPNSVTSIGYAAFNDCTGLTEVTIGNSVTSIGISAFEDCTGLTNLTIPNSVTSIETSAFDGCTGLTSITLGNGVTSIGGSAFYNCNKLSTIICNATTPPTVELSNTFENYNATVYVPAAGLALYQQDAVWSQFNLVAPLELKYSVTDANNKYVAVIQDASYTSYNGAVIIPSTTVIDGVTYTVTSIGNSAFKDCSGITSVTIPSTVTSIDSRAFSFCTALTHITIPNSVTQLGSYLFAESTALKSVTLPESTYELPAFIFSGCWRLTEFIIPSGVKKIQNDAFNLCLTLTSITIPAGVTEIKAGAFNSCDGLKAIFVDENNTVYDSRNNCNAIIETATNTLIEGCRSTVIPNDVTAIGPSAFKGLTGLTSITIPNSVTSIGDSAFESSGLTNLTIPNSVTSIGNGAFYLCFSLESFIIPNNVTSIGKYAFSGCSGLTDITISEKVSSIEEGTFLFCACLTDVTLPNGISSIGHRAFEGCTGLTDVIIPNGVSSIGFCAFKGCTGLTNLTIPNSVTSIGNGAFEDCSKLSAITCNATTPPTVELSSTFENYNATVYVPASALALYQQDAVWSQFNLVALLELKYRVTDANNKYVEVIQDASYASYNGAVIIPTTTVIDSVTYTVTSIGEWAFGGCSGFTEVTIPNSVTSIGKAAFLGCTGLTSVTIPNSVETIGEWAWGECSGLKKLDISQNIQSFEDNYLYGNQQDLTIVMRSLNPPMHVDPYEGFDKSGWTLIIPHKEVLPLYKEKGWIGEYKISYISEIEPFNFEANDICYKAISSSEVIVISNVNKYSDSVVIPSSVEYDSTIYSVTSIGENAFSDCTGLTSITIPNSVTSIGNYAFENCI